MDHRHGIGTLVDANGNTWRDSGGTSHPILMEALNKAIKSGKNADWDAVPSSLLRYFNGYKNRWHKKGHNKDHGFLITWLNDR